LQISADVVRVIAVIPTYNELDNLERLVDSIRKLDIGIHILVVDDNSPDGTGKLAASLSLRHPGEVFVLQRESKEGLGRAYLAAFQYVLKNFDYDIIIQMDCDFSHDPAYIPDFLKAIEQADLVLGSRYLTGVNVVNWDFKRLLLSKSASAYARLITGMPYSDLTGGFKCWRRGALEGIRLDRVFSVGYLFQVETTYRVWKTGKFKIAEIPIIFYERNRGRSKIHLGIILESIIGVIRLRFTRG
jgi:dolichol-phosphate mannosyltransferase